LSRRYHGDCGPRKENKNADDGDVTDDSDSELDIETSSVSEASGIGGAAGGGGGTDLSISGSASAEKVPSFQVGEKLLVNIDIYVVSSLIRFPPLFPQTLLHF
jgi:hypothetical protein